jgi:NAD(P)-dependent dehydrogenase (short-subunit alcohol dehydrogenase family)
MNRVAGKVAVVTGGSLGIGRACCVRLAEEGAAVAVTDILDEEGRALADEICDGGGKAAYWHLDVSSEDQVASVMREVQSRFGPVTVLVNNAGISGVNKPTHEIESEEWDQLMDVNVKGVFYCTKHVLSQMLEAGHGSIVNMSSIYGIVSAPDLPPYHASKGAVRMMTKTDALIYAKNGIRVNSVHPGFIWTPMVENFAKSLGEIEAMKENIASLHPVGRMGESDDIAWGVVYLASDESKFVTGTELIIDGGYTAR